MGRNEAKFIKYDVDERFLIPPSWDDLIPEKHVVRTINQYFDQLNIDKIIESYPGGGRSSYHPKMMLKSIVYCYTQKIYSSRMIAKAMRENINVMWIAGRNTPDFRTINRFRLKLKDSIQEVFYSIVEMLLDQKYIDMDNYFLDGTKMEANANKYTFVWKKSTKNYQKKLREKIESLLIHIDKVTDQENKIYGDKDLNELGEDAEIDSTYIRQKAEELSKRLNEDPNNKELKKAVKELKEGLPRMEKYENYLSEMENRNSFSKIDKDATFMRMKEDHMRNGQLKAGYNIQIGTENQFILGYSIHQKPGDTTTLIPHLKEVTKYLKRKPTRVVTDAGYGSQENYQYLKDEEIDAYVKYNMYHKEQKKKFKKQIFRKENLPYDTAKDEFTCPAGKNLKYMKTVNKSSENNYPYELRIYECEDCTGCGFKDKCHRGKSNRTIQINRKLDVLRNEAKELLNSDQGINLRRRRGIEPETVFGNIKANGDFKRFLLRGIKKVGLEWGLLSLAHNFKRLQGIIENRTPAVISVQPL